MGAALSIEVCPVLYAASYVSELLTTMGLHGQRLPLTSTARTWRAAATAAVVAAATPSSSFEVPVEPPSGCCARLACFTARTPMETRES